MEKESKTRWHRLLGALLEKLLVPVGISVFVDFPLMSAPPESDILLLRKEGHTWSEQQKARLPDGIRDSRASHILIEFKYTESVNEYAIRQILSYDHFYRNVQDLKKEELESFLISAKTPQKSTLKQFGYMVTDQPGVYRSTNTLIKAIPLLTLNELPDKEYNAWFKCFAARKEKRESAFGLIEQNGVFALATELGSIIRGLYTICFKGGEKIMKYEITPEILLEVGDKLKNAFISHLNPEIIDEILSTLKPEEVFARYKPEERLIGLKPEERLIGLKPEEVFASYKPEDIEAYLKMFRTRKKKQKRS